MIVRDPETSVGERAKILDFGLAKIIEPEGGEGITNTGTILGTPAYMAPEQCKSARAADPKSDVYSLGVIFYEMLSGEIPFDADTDAELLSKHMFADAPPLLSKAPQTGMALAALVHRMLGKDTESRPSAGEVAAELHHLHASASISTAAVDAVVAAPATEASSRRNAAPVAVQPKVESAKAAVPAAVPPQSAPTAPADESIKPTSRRGMLWFFLSLFLCGTGAAVFWQLKGHQLVETFLRKPPVRWSITSIPAEADVLDENGKLLGKTPLSVERPLGSGSASLTLRLDGYLDQPISLPLSTDTAVSEKLQPLPKPQDVPTGFAASSRDAGEAGSPVPPTDLPANAGP